MKHEFETTEIEESEMQFLGVNFEASVKEMVKNLCIEALRRREERRLSVLLELSPANRVTVEAAIDSAIKATVVTYEP